MSRARRTRAAVIDPGGDAAGCEGPGPAGSGGLAVPWAVVAPKAPSEPSGGRVAAGLRPRPLPRSVARALPRPLARPVGFAAPMVNPSPEGGSSSLHALFPRAACPARPARPLPRLARRAIRPASASPVGRAGAQARAGRPSGAPTTTRLPLLIRKLVAGWATRR